jgi:hypothetical protein
MEIKGKIIQVLPLQTGEGKNGVWKKQEFILETSDSQYPKKICMAAWGDKFGDGAISANNEVNVSFDVESREYNGRWYTDVKVWKIDVLSGLAGVESQPTAAPSSIPMPTPVSAELAGEEDLPF